MSIPRSQRHCCSHSFSLLSRRSFFVSPHSVVVRHSLSSFIAYIRYAMNSLLLPRYTSSISPLEFATSYVEALYTTLKPRHPFPTNCHGAAAVNGLDLERQDNRFLLSGGADSMIKLWDVSSLTVQCVATIPRKSVHQFGISSIQWWPHDTGMFISGSFDHTVKVWDTNEMEPVHSFDIDHRVYSVDTNRIGDSLVAVASDQPFVRLLDLRQGLSVHTLSGHKGKTLAVKWHPQYSYLVATGGYDGEVRLWDIRRARSCLCRLDQLQTNSGGYRDEKNLSRASVKAHLGPVNGISWNEVGTELYTTGNDDKVRVWDATALSPPPVNKLINFGPLTRNKYPQTIPLVVTPHAETEMSQVVFPSDTGDVFVFRTIDGKMVTRLTGDGRTSAMVYGEPFLATIYCGTTNGSIMRWEPQWKRPANDDVVEHELEGVLLGVHNK